MRRSASCKDIKGYGELLCRLDTLKQCQTDEGIQLVQITHQAQRGRVTTLTLVVEYDAHAQSPAHGGGDDDGDDDAHPRQYPEERRRLLIQHGLSVQSLP